MRIVGKKQTGEQTDRQEAILMPGAVEPLCSSCVFMSSQSSVVHPLLQLVPQLHERRMKRYKVNVCKTDCMPALPLCGDPFR